MTIPTNEGLSMATNALEAIKRPARVRMARGVHQEHAPRPVTVVDPDNLQLAVEVVQARIRRVQRTGAGSYLFIDNDMRAYVLTEIQTAVPKWVREHFAWLVAFYAPRRRDGSKKNPDGTPYLTATAAGLTEDIGQHLADMRASPA